MTEPGIAASSDQASREEPVMEAPDPGMSRASRLGRQAALNVASAVLAGVYSIWLTAFLVGRLGSGAYGTWATVIAVLTPLLVLDAGLGLLVVRASASHAVGRLEAAAEAHTAHGMYLGLGVICLLAGLALGLLPGPLLGLTGAEARDARVAAWILAADFGLVIGTSALPALLKGRQRYGPILAASLLQVGVGVALSVGLVPIFGLVGAALAQLASHATARFIQLLMVRRLIPWFALTPSLPAWSALRRVIRFSAPLLVISIASQLSFSTDVIVVGAVAGATAASWIAIGARLPVLAVSLLSMAMDVLFPAFVEDELRRPNEPSPILWRAIMVAGFLGGCAFWFLASARTEILNLWVPGTDPVAATVFALYCGAWAIHMPAHVLSLLIVAHDRHATMAPIVLVESIANLLLSIYFVIKLGPVGAAVGSFIAVGVSNGLVLPLIAKWRLHLSFIRVVVVSVAGLAAGAAVAVAGWLVVELGQLAGVERLAVQAVLTGVCGMAGVAILWIGRRPMRKSSKAGATG